MASQNAISSTQAASSCNGCDIAVAPTTVVFGSTGTGPDGSPVTIEPTSYIVFSSFRLDTTIAQSNNALGCRVSPFGSTTLDLPSQYAVPANPGSDFGLSAASEFFSAIGTPGCGHGTVRIILEQTSDQVLGASSTTVASSTGFLTSTPSKTASPVSTPSVSGSSESSVASSISQTNNLSVPTKAGIAVGACLGAIVIALLTFWLVKRSRKRKGKAEAVHASTIAGNGSEVGYTKKPELEAHGRVEVGGENRSRELVSQTRHELEAAPNRGELRAGEVALEKP